MTWTRTLNGIIPWTTHFVTSVIVLFSFIFYIGGIQDGEHAKFIDGIRSYKARQVEMLHSMARNCEILHSMAR
jgi:hypothetical protein